MKNAKIISILVANHFGALTRVSNVFSRRGININHLTAAETRHEGISRITILTTEVEADFIQLEKQLNKIEDVIEAVIFSYDNAISKEILLVKIKYDETNLDLIQEVLVLHGGRIISFDSQIIVGQIVGSTKRITDFLKMAKEFEIVESSRSGITALHKKHKTFN